MARYQVLGLSLLVSTVGCGDPPASAEAPQSSSTHTILAGPGGSRMTATQGPAAPELPSYAPVYPGAKNLGGGVVAANSAQPGGVTKTVVNLTTPDSVAQVVDFYTARLRASAVTPSVMQMSPDMAMVSGDATALETGNGVELAMVSIAVSRDGATTVVGVAIDRQVKP